MKRNHRPLSVAILIGVGTVGFFVHMPGLQAWNAFRFDGVWIELIELSAVIPRRVRVALRRAVCLAATLLKAALRSVLPQKKLPQRVQLQKATPLGKRQAMNSWKFRLSNLQRQEDGVWL